MLLSVLAAILLGLTLVVTTGHYAHAASLPKGGITVAPAILTFDAPSGQVETSRTISITNHYNQPVQLHFAFEADADTTVTNTASKDVVASFLHVEKSVLALQPGEKTTQTITLRASPHLVPGSQDFRLVINQRPSNTDNVGVAGSIHIPITVITREGAITRLALLSTTLPNFVWNTPDRVLVVFRNEGNVTIIPRGHIRITDHHGTVIRQGAINTESLAVSSGKTLSLRTTLLALQSGLLPGRYTATTVYGLGAGQPTQQSKRSFWYVAWWHVLIIVGGIVGIWAGIRRYRHARTSNPIPAHAKKPKRPLLIGRDLV